MQVEVGSILEGKVTSITNFGVFVDLGDGKTGMVHISEVAPTYVNQIKDHIQENQTVKVKVLGVSDDGKISLSIKRAMERPKAPNRASYASPGKPDGEWAARRSDGLSFEEMMNKYKQSSEDKFSDLKRKNNDARRKVKRSK